MATPPKQAFKAEPTETTGIELARAGGAFQRGRIERAGQIAAVGFGEAREQLKEFQAAILKARKKAVLSDAVMIGLGIGGIALGLPAVAVAQLSRLGATAVSGQLPSPEVQAGIGAGAQVVERGRFEREKESERAFARMGGLPEEKNLGP